MAPGPSLTAQWLGRHLADSRRPVAQRPTGSDATGGAGAGAEQVVARTPREERAAPGGVATRVRHVLARDPHRVAVDGRRAVVAPPGTRRVAAHLGLVAGEPVS